jgi:hypothetical protein
MEAEAQPGPSWYYEVLTVDNEPLGSVFGSVSGT